ncbi:MAG: TolC family protein [Bacillota bacterium]
MRKSIVLLVTLVLTVGLSLPAAFAESAEKSLTLEQAIALALQKNTGVKKAESEIDRTEALRKQAADKVLFTPIMGGSGYDAETESNWNKLLSADLNWQMSKKTFESTKDSLVLNVYKSYWDVQTAQMKLDLQKKLNQQALIKLQDTRTGIRAGTVSPSDLVAVEAAWQQAQSNLVTTQNALDTAYTDFNQLLGLNPNERPQLTGTPVYEPLNVTDLDYEVEKAIGSSPRVWEAQQNVTKAEWSADMIYSSGDYTPYEVRQISVYQAELSAVDARDSLEKTVRNLYYQIKNLEEDYSIAQKTLQTAQENLRVAKLKFDAGMSTNAEVVAAEIEVARDQESIEEMVRNHAYLKMSFEKPWTA